MKKTSFIGISLPQFYRKSMRTTFVLVTTVTSHLEVGRVIPEFREDRDGLNVVNGGQFRFNLGEPF